MLLMLMTAAASAKSGQGGPASRDAGPYLDATIDNRSPYVGQEVLLTYSLYFSGIAPRIADTGKAEHTGLWVREVTPEGYIRSTAVAEGGRSFRRAVVKQLKMVPMQAGRLSVSNYRIKCLLPPVNGAADGSTPDVESIITAPTATIVARPLPKGAPAGFNGAVGEFSIGIASESYRIRAGEPLALEVKISGKGNLQAFPQVELELPPGFRRAEGGEPSAMHEDVGGAGDAVRTKITIVSDRPGSYRFTPVRLTAFNPWKGRYETLASGTVAVTVLPPGKDGGSAAPAPLPAVPPPDRWGWVPSAVMLLMAAAILALIIHLFVAAKKHRKRPEKAPAGTQEPKPQPAARPGVQPKAGSPEQMRRRIYDALARAGIGKPAGLTSNELRKELEAQKVGKECAEALIEALHLIDRAAYTPGETAAEALEKLEMKAVAALAMLDRERSR